MTDGIRFRFAGRSGRVASRAQLFGNRLARGSVGRPSKAVHADALTVRLTLALAASNAPALARHEPGFTSAAVVVEDHLMRTATLIGVVDARGWNDTNQRA